MAFLDHNDVTERLYSLLPAGWFPDLGDAPTLNGILSMLAAAYANNSDGLYEFLEYTRDQSRVATATGFWLDLIALDYFGPNLQRHTDESDVSYRRRIMVNLLAPRGTRQALVANLGNLTGFLPKIIELRNTGDCGAYSSLANPTWGGAVYGAADATVQGQGAYGTMIMPYQLLVQATRPSGEGIPLVNGYSMNGSGYATVPRPYGFVGALRPPVNTWGAGEYVTLQQITGMVTDDDIYQTVAETMPAGTIGWTAISSPFVEMPPTGGGALLNCNFYTNLSVIGHETVSPAPNVFFGLPHTISIIMSGKIVNGAKILGTMTIPLSMSGFLATVPPITWSGVWTLPIGMVGSMTARPNILTIPISFGPTVIYTTNIQPLIPHTMPFILGTVPRAQPLLGVNFQLGLDAPGEEGNIALVGVQSNFHLGQFDISLPPALQSVSGSGVAGAVVASGTKVAIQSTALGVTSVCHAATIGAAQPLVLPQTMPFLLGSTRVAPTVNLPVPSVVSTTHVGVMAQLGALAGVQTNTLLGNIGAVTGGPQGFSPARTTSTVSVSNNNLTATQTGTSADPVIAAKSANIGTYYWEVTIHSVNPSQVTAGVANASINVAAGQFVGANANAAGWTSSGTILVNDIIQAASTPSVTTPVISSSTYDTITVSWPASTETPADWSDWTSTGFPSAPSLSLGSVANTSVALNWTPATDSTTLCFALDAGSGILWGRVANGPWNAQGTVVTQNAGVLTLGQTALGSGTASQAAGIVVLGATELGTPLVQVTGGSADPTTNTGGFVLPASVRTAPLCPAVTLYSKGDFVTAAFTASSWQFSPPVGFGPW